MRVTSTAGSGSCGPPGWVTFRPTGRSGELSSCGAGAFVRCLTCDSCSHSCSHSPAQRRVHPLRRFALLGQQRARAGVPQRVQAHPPESRPPLSRSRGVHLLDDGAGRPQSVAGVERCAPPGGNSRSFLPRGAELQPLRCLAPGALATRRPESRAAGRRVHRSMTSTASSRRCATGSKLSGPGGDPAAPHRGPTPTTANGR